MSAILRVTDAARNAQLNSIRDLIDAGSSGGLLRIYDGSQPADADDAITTQNLLVELVFAIPSAPNASGGTLTFSTIPAVNATMTGIAAWARILDTSANKVLDCNVGILDEVIVLNTTSLVAGGSVQINSFTLSAPSG